jgi:hypothetical protein
LLLGLWLVVGSLDVRLCLDKLLLLGLLLGGLLLAYLTEKLVELLLRDLNELLVI